MVVGIARVTEVTSGPLGDLWKRFSGIGGITKHEYTKYFDGKHEGFVLSLGEVVLVSVNSSLVTLCRDKRPPQCFRYLDEITANTVISEFAAHIHATDHRCPVLDDDENRRASQTIFLLR